MISREYREVARIKLDNGIFTRRWVSFLLVCLLFDLIMGLVSPITFGLGTLFMFGAMNGGLTYVSLMLSRTDDEIDVTNLFYAFKEDYTRYLMIGVYHIVFVFLWSLLFIIPGLIKMYSYSMCFYLANDNLDLSPIDCIDNSKELMDGNKWRLFKLHLSFIGWFFVGVLTAGIGFLWIVPYIKQSETAFYEDIVKNYGSYFRDK